MKRRVRSERARRGGVAVACDPRRCPRMTRCCGPSEPQPARSARRRPSQRGHAVAPGVAGHRATDDFFFFPLFFGDPRSRHLRLPAGVLWSLWLYYLLWSFLSLFFLCFISRVSVVLSLILLTFSSQINLMRLDAACFRLGSCLCLLWSLTRGPFLVPLCPDLFCWLLDRVVVALPVSLPAIFVSVTSRSVSTAQFFYFYMTGCLVHCWTVFVSCPLSLLKTGVEAGLVSIGRGWLLAALIL